MGCCLAKKSYKLNLFSSASDWLGNELHFQVVLVLMLGVIIAFAGFVLVKGSQRRLVKEISWLVFTEP